MQAPSNNHIRVTNSEAKSSTHVWSREDKQTKLLFVLSPFTHKRISFWDQLLNNQLEHRPRFQDQSGVQCNLKQNGCGKSIKMSNNGNNGNTYTDKRRIKRDSEGLK
jgi:hypothetical protein